MKVFDSENPHKNKVHKTLAQSYVVYFLFFLLGVFLDLVFQVKIFTDSVMVFLGTLLLAFGTFLIFWAQRTSRNLHKDEMSKESFSRGPYRYTRSPTHFGLFVLILGFGIITNAVFVVLGTLLAFLITKFSFLDKHEKILEAKYGEHYKEYKKIVKF